MRWRVFTCTLRGTRKTQCSHVRPFFKIELGSDDVAFHRAGGAYSFQMPRLAEWLARCAKHFVSILVFFPLGMARLRRFLDCTVRTEEGRRHER